MCKRKESEVKKDLMEHGGKEHFICTWVGTVGSVGLHSEPIPNPTFLAERIIMICTFRLLLEFLTLCL